MRGRPANRDDAFIHESCLSGLTCPQIGAKIGRAGAAVRLRVVALGLVETADANVEAARPFWKKGKCGGARLIDHGHKMLRAIAPPRADDSASRLVMHLRAAPRPTFHDPDGALACLHRRGLTLDDFEVCFGISPVEAVAAIRRSA